MVLSWKGYGEWQVFWVVWLGTVHRTHLNLPCLQKQPKEACLKFPPLMRKPTRIRLQALSLTIVFNLSLGYSETCFLAMVYCKQGHNLVLSPNAVSCQLRKTCTGQAVRSGNILSKGSGFLLRKGRQQGNASEYYISTNRIHVSKDRPGLSKGTPAPIHFSVDKILISCLFSLKKKNPQT